MIVPNNQIQSANHTFSLRCSIDTWPYERSSWTRTFIIAKSSFRSKLSLYERIMYTEGYQQGYSSIEKLTKRDLNKRESQYKYSEILALEIEAEYTEKIDMFEHLLPLLPIIHTIHLKRVEANINLESLAIVLEANVKAMK